MLLCATSFNRSALRLTESKAKVAKLEMELNGRVSYCSSHEEGTGGEPAKSRRIPTATTTSLYRAAQGG